MATTSTCIQAERGVVTGEDKEGVSMSRYIDADELKRHIRWEFMRYGGNPNIGYEECKQIDAIIDAEKEIKPFDRDNGAEPILEEYTSTHHELYSDGHGAFVTKNNLDWKCPQCGWFVGELYCGFGEWHIQGKRSYCSKCGQHIDWTKPKEEEKRRYEEEKAKQREEHLRQKGIPLDNMHEYLRRKYGMLEE